MTTLTLAPPTLVVEQQFARRPAGQNRPLLPYIIGPLAHLVRYAESSERANGYLGIYDHEPDVVEGSAQTLYPWPTLPLGADLDHDFTKLYVEAGLARYYQDLTHDVVKVSANRIYSPNAKFGTKGSSITDVIDGGVRVGDLVKISGIDSDLAAFTLATYVVGLSGVTNASAVGVPAAASTNKAAQSQADTVVDGDDNTDSLAIAADGSAYDGNATGHVTETYTVTVTTGGAPGVAKLSVVSASGLDNVSSVAAPTLGVPLNIGTRGLQATWTGDTGVVYVAGDSWAITVDQQVLTPSLIAAGPYNSSQDRVYIIEVVRGGDLNDVNTLVSVTSQSGTDTIPVQTMATDTINLGSYGATVEFTAGAGLVKGDKWTVAVTGEAVVDLRYLVLAHDLPENVLLTTAAELEIEIFRSVTMEIPREAITLGAFNYTGEATQLRVAGGISLQVPSVTVGGVVQSLPLISVGEFTGTNKLYVNYRAWQAASSDLFSVDTDASLDSVLDGPSDPDNPLKYAIDLARIGAAGETIYAFNTGDPSVATNWDAAYVAGERSDAVYGYVPLTDDPDLLVTAAAAVSSANDSRHNAYRVLWASSARATTKAVLDAAATTDEQVALAVVEDDSLATGTQYTQLRLTSANANLLDLGVRVGDSIRYLFEVDSWGNEAYTTRLVSDVRSATTVIVSVPFGAAEVVPKRVEIIRSLRTSDLREHYKTEAGQWSSDLVRHVIAPTVEIGSYSVPGYYAAAILAGFRAYLAPQQPLSTLELPGVLGISGLESLNYNDLNEIAASGGLICHYDYRAATVRIRHGVTAGETEVLARREESMVSARHAALFQINTRLSIYAGQVNLGDDDQMNVLSEQIRGELESLNKALQVQGFTPELGGLIRSLTIHSIEPSKTILDELIIEGTLALGRPGNTIRFRVLIQ